MRLQAFIGCTLACVAGTYAPARSAPPGDARPPVEAFARLPFVRNVTLSPNGQHLAYLVSVDGREFLTTQTIGNPDRAYLLQVDNETVRVSWFRWANDDWLLASASFPGERDGMKITESRLVRVKRTGSKPVPFFRPSLAAQHNPQFQDGVIGSLPDDPQHILVGLDDQEGGYPTAYEVDVETGGKRTVQRYRRPVRRWMADQQGRIRLGVGYEDGVSSVIVRSIETGAWKELWSYKTVREAPTEALGFGADPNILYVRALHEGREAIFSQDLSAPEQPRRLRAHDPRYDIEGGLIYSPKTRDVVGVYHQNADGSRTYWDEGYKRLQAVIDHALPDTTNVLLTLSRDERRYVVRAASAVNPGVYYVGDRINGNLTRIADAYPELSGIPLSGKELVKYPARDGLVIDGYLTRPWGQPPKPWPAVILPHGGPAARDYADFDFLAEFLASRGYAVLQMNFRGSSGYGWDFLRSGFEDLGGRMQDDVTDGARWLVAQGSADAKRVCIMGGSYGGYAALWGAIKEPELYRCVISVNGVSDWGLVLAESHSYWNEATIRNQLGAASRLKQVSPLRRAEEIRAPVLLVHSKDDRVVPVAHSRKLAKALQKERKACRYVELDGGGHSLTNERHRTEFLKVVEAFLAEHLPPASRP